MKSALIHGSILLPVGVEAHRRASELAGSRVAIRGTMRELKSDRLACYKLGVYLAG